MFLLKYTKAEAIPSKPITKKVTLKSILGNINTSSKRHAPSVPYSVLPGTPSRRRYGAINKENKKWDPGGSTIIQANSQLILLISTVESSELNNAKDSYNVVTPETQGSDSRTDLNYHANMEVVDQNFYILYDSSNFSEVNAFSPA